MIFLNDGCITDYWSSHRRCDFTQFTGKHLCQSLFSRKLQASGLEINEKKDFDIFLRISRNFPEHLFCRTSSKSCFCASRTNLPQISNKEISDSIRHKLHFLRHILHERASRWVVVVTSRMDHQIFRKIYYF